jgi:hypothetical protein
MNMILLVALFYPMYGHLFLFQLLNTIMVEILECKQVKKYI